MGLEGVEIILDVEDEFKVVLLDSDTEQSETVGQLVDIVHARLRQSADEPCPSQRGFYVVRKQIMEQLGITRSAIKPDTRVEELIPDTEARSGNWRKLIQSLANEDHFSYTLERPGWLSWGVFFILPVIAFVLPWIWLPLDWFLLSFVGGIGLFIGVSILGAYLTTSFKREIPAKFSCVRDLIPFVETLDCKVWTKEEVFEKIREIVVETLGDVKPEQVQLGSRWVDDLRVG